MTTKKKPAYDLLSHILLSSTFLALFMVALIFNEIEIAVLWGITLICFNIGVLAQIIITKEGIKQ